MHKDEVATDVKLVRRLLAAQFPEWAELPVEPVQSSGTDNAMYRLGEAMAVRLPRIQWATGQVAKEQYWLPKIAAKLPLATPLPLALGQPGEGYPWQWSIYRWLEGQPLTNENASDMRQVARTLADFVKALQQLNLGETPPQTTSARGAPLATRDAATRSALEEVRDMLDTETAGAVWETALQASLWDMPPVWIHGDLQPGNLLVQNGQLKAVIDFGSLGVGDPACDLLIAWNFFDEEIRQVYRAALSVDDATWLRGRGWALSVALIALPYYQHTNLTLAEQSRRTIAAVLADYKQLGK